MKQEKTPTKAMKAESKTRTSSTVSLSTTPSRVKASTASQAKDSAKPEIVNGAAMASPSPSPKARPDSIPADIILDNYSQTTTKTSRRRRSLVLNKPKSGRDVPIVGSQKDSREFEDLSRAVNRSINRPVVEKFARPTRQRLAPDPNNSSKKKNVEGDDHVDEKKKEEKEEEEKLKEKLDQNETLIRNLESEILELKSELDKAHRSNVELHSHNKKLSDDLTAAEVKITALTIRDQKEFVPEFQSPRFKDIQKLLANKLEHSVKRVVIAENFTTPKTPSAATVSPVRTTEDVHRKVLECPTTQPPPPPPPPRPSARAATNGKGSAVVQLYQSLARRQGSNGPAAGRNHNKQIVTSAHKSIVGEIQNRSAHILAIKADIETKGEFINGLIQKVLTATYTNIEDVLTFVDQLDNELSSLMQENL